MQPILDRLHITILYHTELNIVKNHPTRTSRQVSRKRRHNRRFKLGRLYDNVKKLRMPHRTYAECGIILDETHKADLVYFLLKRADDYPDIEDWAQEIRHNSILRVSAKYNTIQIYFGGTNYPDDDDHGHVATPFRLDGTINPAAKSYFRPPGYRNR